LGILNKKPAHADAYKVENFEFIPMVKKIKFEYNGTQYEASGEAFHENGYLKYR
jgi:hypothetical protein